MSAVRVWTLAGIGVGLSALLGWWLLIPATGPATGRAPDIATLVGADPGGFEIPAPGQDPALPADHAAHPGFRSELWTLSGNLVDRTGRSYGFQLSLARLALRARPAERPSAWAANQIYRAHFILTPAGSDRPRVAERLSREALGLAGSQTDPPRVWVRDWSIAAGAAHLALAANAEGAALELDLEPVKGATGARELDLFAEGPDGPGFNLYLLPRLRAGGHLTLDGEALEVEGTTMLDHAWGAIPAAGGQLALNRFGLQLEDGRELVCVELRRLDGSGTPIPSCALIGADGRVQSFHRRDLALEPVERWRSPRSGTDYPVAWTLAIRPLDLRLRLSPLTKDQELDLSVRLWSGAVEVTGEQSGTPVAGSGRIELTAAPGDGPA